MHRRYDNKNRQIDLIVAPGDDGQARHDRWRCVPGKYPICPDSSRISIAEHGRELP